MISPLVDWLNQLGLGEYLPKFEASAIDMSGLLRLADADLAMIGVKSPEHRQRMLAAIDALPRMSPLVNTPQRRQVTAMFCDLVDSTELTARLDAEDMASVLDVFAERGDQVISRFKGRVHQFRGDELVAYFGYPQAQEGAAEGAIRAALTLTRDIGKLDVGHGISLAVRIGIATGEVFVSGFMKKDELEPSRVVGETPNLAARLRAEAPKDGILIADSTFRLVGGLFDCVSVGPLVLKGIARPVSAWQVIRERPHTSRFEARASRPQSSHFGRETHLARLAHEWHSAETGAGRLALISGDPGIGKSRLLLEFSRSIAVGPKHRFEWIGSPYLKNSPLAPVISQFETAALFSSQDSAETKRAKLAALIAETTMPIAETLPVLAALLSLPLFPGDLPPDPDSARRKQATLQLISDFIASRARLQPVLIVCEDLHWFDPTTLELLGFMVKRLTTVRVLVVATHRADFVPRWNEEPSVCRIELERLEYDLSAAMVRELVKDQFSPTPNFIRQVVDRSDGIPLFIEELTRALLEATPGDDTAAAATKLPIPDTLQELLVARLDSAAPYMEIAQIGSAIGREFSLALLRAVASVDADDLRVTLERLVHSDLLRRQDVCNETVYAFKHALVQDAAYGMLLHSRRRTIHRRIAEAMELRFPDVIASQPERLAEHWERADELERAIYYWKRAGQVAVARSAASEAESHLARALGLIERLPSGVLRDRLELEVTVQQGGVFRATKGPPGTETGKAFSRARELCLQSGERALLMPALAGLFGYYFVRAENSSASEVANELLAFGETTQDRVQRMVGHRVVGMVMVHTGNLLGGCDYLQRSLDLYDREKDGALAFVYGTDHAQTAASFLAMAQWLVGKPDSAFASERWGVAHGSRVNHLYSLVQTAMFRIIVHGLARDWNSVASIAAETLDLAQKHSFRLAINLSRFYLAACRAKGGARKDAIEAMRTAAQAWGPFNYQPLYMAMIAEAQADAHDPAGGLKLLAQAQATVETTGERWIESELHRLRGELILMLDSSRSDEAAAAYLEAIAIARRQSARSWELRAALSLARLDAAEGQSANAIIHLASVYETFTEGFETPELREARRLLGR